MSVSLINKTDLTKAINTLSENEQIQEFVKNSFEYGDYIKYGAESVENFIGRSLWYGYIANITAWNVQYEENEQIDFSDFEEDIKFETLQEGIDTLGYLLYNVCTNSGTCFLADKWLNVLNYIKKEFEVIEEPEIPSWCY